MLELTVALLLPIAAVSGWLSARQYYGNKFRANHDAPSGLSDQYFQGINFAVAGQSEKAISSLLDAADSHPDASDIPIALGNLYRRSGEVGKAINIHTSILVRKGLSRRQHADATLALAMDYQGAGLLERAEEIFRELTQRGQYPVIAQSKLLDIYLSLHDWQRAIDLAKDMPPSPQVAPNEIVAHCFCELAEQARVEGQTDNAIVLARKALASDSRSARANLILGQCFVDSADFNAAIDAYQQIEHQDLSLATLALPKLRECHLRANSIDVFVEYLRRFSRRSYSSHAILMLTELVIERRGLDAGANTLMQHQQSQPTLRGIERLVELDLTRHDRTANETQVLMLQLIRALLRERPRFECGECGFSGKVMHWRCPTCRQWGAIKPRCGLDS